MLTHIVHLKSDLHRQIHPPLSPRIVPFIRTQLRFDSPLVGS